MKSFLEYRIENTNACGYKCLMCPREKQNRRIGFMSLADYELIINQIPKDRVSDIHLHGYGEPLLDPHLLKKIEILKPYPKIHSLIVTTLGLKLSDQKLYEIANSGLTYLMISFYGFTKESYQAIHGVDKLELVKDNLRRLGKICLETDSKLKKNLKILPINNHKTLVQIGHKMPSFELDTAFLKEMHDLNYLIDYTVSLHNYGDGRSFKEPPNRLCSVINGHRSHILNITWNLDVIPCSFDFDAKIKLGNLRHQTIEDIFTSEQYYNFLSAHINNNFEKYSICKACDKSTYKLPSRLTSSLS